MKHDLKLSVQESLNCINSSMFVL